MKSVVGQLAYPLFISDLEAETMKTQILIYHILVVIIMFVESISTLSMAINIGLSKNAVTCTGAELLVNQEGDRSEETDDDSDPCPGQIDCGKI